MTSSSHLDAFFKARFQVVSDLFEQGTDDEVLETQRHNLLANSSIPLYMRVTCCYIMATISEDSNSYLDHGFEILDDMVRMMDNGEGGESFRPWTVRARANLERVWTDRQGCEVTVSQESEVEVEVDEEASDDTIALSQTERVVKGQHTITGDAWTSLEALDHVENRHSQPIPSSPPIDSEDSQRSEPDDTALDLVGDTSRTKSTKRNRGEIDTDSESLEPDGKK